MLIETSVATMTCRYCGGNLGPGLTEDSLLPLCGPSVRIGFLCDTCGNLEAPFPPARALHSEED